MTPPPEQQTILEKTSLCVKCGLCLPHCPTYQITQDENESPRGRITLMQGLASEKLPFNQKLENHLDQCLSCRNCERVCPANVPYGSLIDDVRAYQKSLHPNKRSQADFLRWLVQKPSRMRLLNWILYGLEISGLRRLGRALKIPQQLKMGRLESLLPPIKRPKTLKTHYPAMGEKKGTVGLFTGCMGATFDLSTLQDTCYALQELGFDIHIPKTQQCCGAMALHQGDITESARLAQANHDAFQEDSLDAIIYTASGCGATLKEYQNNLLAKPVTDISQFIVPHIPKKLPALNKTVLLHTPCTLRNVCGTASAPAELLSAIPGLNVIPFSKVSYCCGSAGTYMIEHPDMADMLANAILTELEETKADYLVTSNIGCALHLSRHLKLKNSDVKVIHPISLIAMALRS